MATATTGHRANGEARHLRPGAAAVARSTGAEPGVRTELLRSAAAVAVSGVTLVATHVDAPAADVRARTRAAATARARAGAAAAAASAAPVEASGEDADSGGAGDSTDVGDSAAASDADGEGEGRPQPPPARDPVAALEFSAREGFLRVLPVAVSVLGAVAFAHSFLLTDDHFQFWDVTARRVARPAEWSTWNNTAVPAVPESVLLMYRLGCASLVWWVVGLTVTDRRGIVVNTGPGGTIRLIGAKRLATFSMLSWALVGCFFTCASLCHFPFTASPLLAKVAWVLFEVCCSTSLLIFFVVRFVLIPAARARGMQDVDAMMNAWIPWTVHNVNVAILVGECVTWRTRGEGG
jgi:hypothetical protein